jgi:hypothetical protein
MRRSLKRCASCQKCRNGCAQCPPLGLRSSTSRQRRGIAHRYVSPIVTHKLRNDIRVLEGSGGNIAVLTGHGKVLGIGVSRPQITEALAGLGPPSARNSSSSIVPSPRPSHASAKPAGRKDAITSRPLAFAVASPRTSHHVRKMQVSRLCRPIRARP